MHVVFSLDYDYAVTFLGQVQSGDVGKTTGRKKGKEKDVSVRRAMTAQTGRRSERKCESERPSRSGTGASGGSKVK